MRNTKVDVVVNAFGKPYQTALCFVSLLRYAGENIHTIYLIIENRRPKYDDIDLYFLSRLYKNIICFTPEYWTGIDALDCGRMHDMKYRHSVRYQYAWEKTENDFLLVLHNDIYFYKNIIVDMLEKIGENIAIGTIGQCWNCPACREHIVAPLHINDGVTCSRESYDAFRLSFNDLNEMYLLVDKNGEHYRHFLPTWSQKIKTAPWPLPECRVNETCCLINMKQARKATVPYGKARPFGAYISAGCHNMDLGVAWFRDVNHQGFRAKHFDWRPYLRHFGGHSRLFHEDAYVKAETQAAEILKAEYPHFVRFCHHTGIPLFRTST